MANKRERRMAGKASKTAQASAAQVELRDDIDGYTAPTAKATVAKLPPLPKLPKAARKPKALHACRCGCGQQTASRFCPGHDSRLKGWCLRVNRGVVKLADIPSGERERVELALSIGRVETETAA